MQERLRKELEGRTQGPSETISTYLCKVRDLLDQLKPPLTLHEQLDRVYQKLHPSYRMMFDRKDFETFPELQKLGKKEELRRDVVTWYTDDGNSSSVFATIPFSSTAKRTGRKAGAEEAF